jgi:hypothetical protein
MKLIAQSGPLARNEFALSPDKNLMVIGRGTESDIQLPDGQVSRRHAEIRLMGDQISIADAGSTNGTYVNGERIQGTRVLRPGDAIRIGSSEFVLDAGVAPAGAPVSATALFGASEPVTRKTNLLPIIGGVAALALIAVAAAVAFFMLRPGGQLAGQATSTPQAPAPLSAQVTATGVQQAATVAAPATPAPSGPTPTSLIELFVTFTPAPVAPTVPIATTAAAQIGGTPQAPPFTVVWSPGRYEGWAEGRRMSSDLTIQNNNLAEIKPPYTPYFIISDTKGKMRQADLQDYGGGKGPPTLAKGQKVTWTWFGVMSNQEWVRGSVFRYAGYSWAQEFNPDGSLNGAPRVIDEKQMIPFLPKEIPPEMLPTIIATMAAGGMPTGIPGGIPTGIPTGIPKP